MEFFHFKDPAFLWLLLCLPFIAFLFGKTGPEASVQFSSTALFKEISHCRRSRAGVWMLMIRLFILAFVIAALARPQLGKMNESTNVEGIDIVLTLDLSGSMRALDLSTQDNIVTRLDAAKNVVLDFIDQRPHDRIALVVFAVDAYVVSPLTLNHDWLKKNLQRLELGEINGGGTAIGTAIGASVNRLRDHEARSRVIVLLTDGENNAGTISPMGAAEAAVSYGVKIYAIATGQKGTVPVAETDRDGRIIRDDKNQPLYRGRKDKSNYDETELSEIASITGGQFYSAKRGGELKKIYNEIDTLEKTEVELRSYASFTELFIWPCLIALLLLSLEQGLLNTRYRRLP